DCAGSPHISFFDKRARGAEIRTNAGWCIVSQHLNARFAAQTKMLHSKAVAQSFAFIAATFYPTHDAGFPAQEKSVHPSAKIGDGVVVSSGAIIGPGAEIGDQSRIGANAVVGRGVAIGRSCDSGA